MARDDGVGLLRDFNTQQNRLRAFLRDNSGPSHDPALSHWIEQQMWDGSENDKEEIKIAMAYLLQCSHCKSLTFGESVDGNCDICHLRGIYNVVRQVTPAMVEASDGPVVYVGRANSEPDKLNLEIIKRSRGAISSRLLGGDSP